MKTVGERIRQAREARKLSGSALADLVGYKNQSAIGNLENRPGASGGNKIGAIAAALGVTVDWLLNGPDTDAVPWIEDGATSAKHHTNSTAAHEAQPQYEAEILSLYRRLNATGRQEATDYLHYLVQKQDKSAAIPREGHSLPAKKKAA